MTEEYDVQLTMRAAQELGRFEYQLRERLVKTLVVLSNDPRPPTVGSLLGHPSYLRLLVDDARIIYTVDDERRQLLVFSISSNPSGGSSLL